MNWTTFIILIVIGSAVYAWLLYKGIIALARYWERQPFEEGKLA